MDQTGGTPPSEGPVPPPGGAAKPPTTPTTPTTATSGATPPTSTATTPTSTASTTSSGGSAWRTWLPALAFVLGAALTAAVFLIGGSGDDDSRLAAPPDGDAAVTAQPSPTPRATDPALLVRVPEACVEAAEFTDTVTSSLGDLAGAARDFDARRLQETLDALQQLRPEVEAASRECRDLAAEGEIVTGPSSPTPEADQAEPTQPSAPEPTDAPSVSGAPTPAA